MGQIVNVVERPSTRPGIVRFETNRVLSGTGHDRFVAGEDIVGERPVDELARRIFARGGVSSVHVNGGVVTVDLAKGFTADGIADILRGLYTYYRPEAVEAAASPDAPVIEAEPAEADVAGQAPTHGESVADPADV